MVLLAIEVVNTYLDYNILLEYNYMYATNVVNSSVFHIMLFLHNRKIVTLEQLTYYEPHSNSSPENILPIVGLENCS